MSDAASIVVMAVIFAFGIVALTLLIVSIVPAAMLLESKLSELRSERREEKAAPPEGDGAA